MGQLLAERYIKHMKHTHAIEATTPKSQLESVKMSSSDTIMLLSKKKALFGAVTPCACAAEGRVIGLSVSQSVCPSGLSTEGLVEGLFQNRSVRIQKLLVST